MNNNLNFNNINIWPHSPYNEMTYSGNENVLKHYKENLLRLIKVCQCHRTPIVYKVSGTLKLSE